MTKAGDDITTGINEARQTFRQVRGPLLGLFWKVILAGIVLSLIFGVIGFVGGWFRTAAHVVSPQNVTAQWSFAYRYNEALRAIAAQDCTALQAVRLATTDEERAARRTQVIAIEQNYARVEAQYDARLANAFEAKLVRPRDVPARAPTLAEQAAC